MSRPRRPNQPVFTGTKEAGTAGGNATRPEVLRIPRGTRKTADRSGAAFRRIARQEMVRSGIGAPIQIVAFESRRKLSCWHGLNYSPLRLKEPPVTPAPRPNILFIVVDDCGYTDLGCTGQTDYSTPALDRLASEGVRFTQAYANAPLCDSPGAVAWCRLPHRAYRQPELLDELRGLWEIWNRKMLPVPEQLTPPMSNLAEMLW
jgi:Sulfatase